MLAAGLKGIENKYELRPPTEENIFNMSDEQKKHNDIHHLPNSLENAIRAAVKSDLVRETLGDHVFEKLIQNKWIEWDQYRVHVSQYEVDKYLQWL
jgi:glutamine synthetase